MIKSLCGSDSGCAELLPVGLPDSVVGLGVGLADVVSDSDWASTP